MTETGANKDDNIWGRQLSKRLASLRSVKSSPNYKPSYLRSPTPDAFDRTLTKRRWQRKIQYFRRALRDHIVQSPAEWLGGLLEAEVTPTTSFSELDIDNDSSAVEIYLCGTWQDQHGSVYKLSLGRQGTFHVETTRPNGRQRYTRDLVSVVATRGNHKIIWGRFRYEMERHDSNALFWRGFSEHDVFIWHRVS